jgi:AraC-like DNA-binding protein
VFVPANTRHVMHFSGDAIACFYADPAAREDVGAVSAAMRSCVGALRFAHCREAELCDVYARFAAREIGRDELRERLLATLGLKEPAPPTDERVARAIRAIREQPALPHTLRSLAAEVGLSESRLRHAFKAATGVPVARYRLWVRIAAALRLVRQGSDLTSAAHRAGFSSSAHFSNAYKGMFGMTPSQLVAAERASRENVASARDCRNGRRSGVLGCGG